MICSGLKLGKPEMINTSCPGINMHTNIPWHVLYQRLRSMFEFCWNKTVNEEFCIFDFLCFSQDFLTKTSKTWKSWLLNIWNASHWVSTTCYLLQKRDNLSSAFRIKNKNGEKLYNLWSKYQLTEYLHLMACCSA